MTIHVHIPAEPDLHGPNCRLDQRRPDALPEQARRELDVDLDAGRDGVWGAMNLLDSIASPPSDDQRPRACAPPRLTAWRVRNLETLIETHIDEVIRVEVMAKQLGMSSSLFSRACRNTFGVTPHGLLVRRRLERSQTMMLSGDESLSEIALACGFSDQSHFSRLFQKAFGAPPGRWRRLRRVRA